MIIDKRSPRRARTAPDDAKRAVLGAVAGLPLGALYAFEPAELALVEVEARGCARGTLLEPEVAAGPWREWTLGRACHAARRLVDANPWPRPLAVTAGLSKVAVGLAAWAGELLPLRAEGEPAADLAIADLVARRHDAAGPEALALAVAEAASGELGRWANLLGLPEVGVGRICPEPPAGLPWRMPLMEAHAGRWAERVSKGEFARAGQEALELLVDPIARAWAELGEGAACRARAEGAAAMA